MKINRAVSTLTAFAVLHGEACITNTVIKALSCQCEEGLLMA